MLQFDNVRLSFPEFELQADVAAPEGARIAVMGASGSGKSTLLSVIAGFATPDAGTLSWRGGDLNAVPIAQRPISVLFQDGNLFPHLDVFDNAALALRGDLNLHEDERRAVMRSIEKVGLSGFEKRKPAALSGGQQSRAALARVLLRDRPLTLLDEPFAALDPGLRIEMLALIADLSQATGQTVLMATHDFRDAERLCDRIWFMEGGKLVLDAPVAGLRDAAPDLIKAWL